MNTKEAAAVIGCTTQQVTQLIRQKKLKAKKIKCSFNRHGYIFDISKSEAERIRDLEHSAGRPRKGAN